jgi:hypothetical protein
MAGKNTGPWSPAARAKREATIAEKKKANLDQPAKRYFPLTAIPAKPHKRQKKQKGTLQAKSSPNKIALALAVIALLTEILS